jgi:hypothetical protein
VPTRRTAKTAMIASIGFLLPAKKDGFLSSGEDGGGGPRPGSPEGEPGSAVSGGEVAVMPELK